MQDKPDLTAYSLDELYEARQALDKDADSERLAQIDMLIRDRERNLDSTLADDLVPADLHEMRSPLPDNAREGGLVTGVVVIVTSLLFFFLAWRFMQPPMLSETVLWLFYAAAGLGALIGVFQIVRTLKRNPVTQT